MTSCLVCLEPVRGEGRYHPRCIKRLFDTGRLPGLDIDTSRLHTAALAMVGHTSLSGIQKKISLGLDARKATLTVVAEGGAYIFKPQTGTYPAIPENEHVTTRLAELAGIETADSGLLELSDGTRAFIVRRFDRRADGTKVHQEDFCQLAGEPPKNKYTGSAERCVRIVREFASEPLIELRRLFRLLLFCWWTGNGDMHLKNFSLLIDAEGIVRLTPAYDLVATQLVIPDDPLALPVGGKNQKLTRGDWLRFAEYAGLPKKAAARLIGDQADLLDDALTAIRNSYLPPTMQQAYTELLQERTSGLT